MEAHLCVRRDPFFIFDMYWPHASEINKSSLPRRSIFMTFNGISKGDLREAHYKDRASKTPTPEKSNLTSSIKLNCFSEKK